jgi:nicotinamide-nucleotide amidase
MGGHGK